MIIVNENHLWAGATRSDAMRVLRLLRERGVDCYIGWRGIPEPPTAHPRNDLGRVWDDVVKAAQIAQ